MTISARNAAPQPAFGDPAAADAAHRAIRADPSIQFDLPWHTTDIRPPPRWLSELFEGLGRFVKWVGDGWTVMLWIAAGAAVLTILFVTIAPLRRWLAARLSRKLVDHTPGWTPHAATARALLAQADQLAARGDYTQAVRLILHRSIEDIEAWRGDPLRPSLTSRDITGIAGLPGAARSIFARIVADVERSLFGGAALGRAEWERTRADYAKFALGPAGA